MAKNWLWMTAADLGRDIAAGRINAMELTEAFLDTAAAHEHMASVKTERYVAVAQDTVDGLAALHDRADVRMEGRVEAVLPGDVQRARQ